MGNDGPAMHFFINLLIFTAMQIRCVKSPADWLYISMFCEKLTKRKTENISIRMSIEFKSRSVSEFSVKLIGCTMHRHCLCEESVSLMGVPCNFVTVTESGENFRSLSTWMSIIQGDDCQGDVKLRAHENDAWWWFNSANKLSSRAPHINVLDIFHWSTAGCNNETLTHSGATRLLALARTLFALQVNPGHRLFKFIYRFSSLIWTILRCPAEIILINWKIKQFIRFMYTDAIPCACTRRINFSDANADCRLLDGTTLMVNGKDEAYVRGKMQRKMRRTCDFYILFSNFANVSLIASIGNIDTHSTHAHTHCTHTLHTHCASAHM